MAGQVSCRKYAFIESWIFDFDFIHKHIAHANPQQLLAIAELAKSGNNPLFKEQLLPTVHICLTVAYLKTPKSDKLDFKNKHLIPFTYPFGEIRVELFTWD